jgi:plasmid maintenance system antidote protein VapI
MSEREDMPTIDRARLKGLLALRGLSPTTLAVSVGISARHMELVVSGRRPLTRKVAEGIQRALGADGWAFVSGQAHELRDCRAERAEGGHDDE